MSTTVQPSTAPSTPTGRDSDSARAERIEQHVDHIIAEIAKPTPTEAFEALVAEHGFQVEEWDTDDLDGKLRDKFFAFYLETADRKVIVVPVGQDPAHRLAAVRALLAHPGVIA